MKKLSKKHTPPDGKAQLLRLGLIAVFALLSACSSSDSDDDDKEIEQTATERAIVATVAPDFSSGAHAVINIDPTYQTQQDLAPTVSDIVLAAHGSHFYRIERFNRDNITKFKSSEPATPIWQFSTLDSGEQGSGNPQTIIFKDENKAYILRWGKSSAWVVDPSATDQASFKLGEIDLSAYDDGDGAVEMQSGVIVGDKLFIAMQRFDSSFNPLQAYVAVIDTATDKEIDTETGEDNVLDTGAEENFKGIALPVRNPNAMQVDETGMIYVQGSGKFNFGGAEPEYTGGIATLDPETFESELLIDDGDAEDHPFGQIIDMQIVSSQNGYFVAQKSFADASLFAFNPMTGQVSEEPVTGISGVNIGGLAVDNKEQLWVSLFADATETAGIRLLNGKDASIVKDKIELNLNPTSIVFTSEVDPILKSGRDPL